MFASPFSQDISFIMLPSNIRVYYPAQAAELKLLSAHATERRRKDFLLGRGAAHLALRTFGIDDPGPVLKGLHREPLWPVDIVGAITHTKSWAAAAVGRTELVASIGLDLQQLEQETRYDISKHVCTERELSLLKKVKQPNILLALFSAKESVFKALFPLVQVQIGFHDVELVWDGNCFQGTVLKNLGQAAQKGFSFQVQVHFKNDYVLTSMQLNQGE